MTKTWIAAVVAFVLLLGGGVGGYFIGAANDHDGRPGWHERGWPGGGPEGFRGEGPRREGGGPWQDGSGPRQDGGR